MDKSKRKPADGKTKGKNRKSKLDFGVKKLFSGERKDCFPALAFFFGKTKPETGVGRFFRTMKNLVLAKTDLE